MLQQQRRRGAKLLPQAPRRLAAPGKMTLKAGNQVIHSRRRRLIREVEQAVEESAPQLARPLALEGLAQAQRHQACADRQQGGMASKQGCPTWLLWLG